MISIYFLLLVAVYAENYSTRSDFTDSYYRYESGRLNNIFLEDTFFNLQHLNVCTIIKYKYQYVKLLEEYGVKCHGEWCINGKYDCTPHNECYNMMHVIDPKKSYPDVGEEYNRNILGNLVMAYGTWVQQLKGRSWEDTKKEKKIILGDIFYIALQNVKKCKDGNLLSTSEHLSTYKHTSTYNEWKNGQFKQNDFFMEESYMHPYGINPCTKITSREMFINILEKNGVTCKGKWCDEKGGYSCKKGDSRNCYNMEHIIDVKNSLPEFDETYDREIVGNLVMAYGKWNQDIGAIKDWDSIKNEKSEVYGYIFDEAAQNVIMCRDRNLKDTNHENINESITEDTEDNDLLQSIDGDQDYIEENLKYFFITILLVCILGMAIFSFRFFSLSRGSDNQHNQNVELPPTIPGYENYDSVIVRSSVDTETPQDNRLN